MAAPREVRTLIQRFQGNRAAYVSGPYNETQLRREFLDPLFIALGWDVANVSGAAEAYKDVVHEDAIKVSGATKAPDYCFRIGGTRKFFVEAKRPSIKIKEDASSAYQLRRYAWSAKLPLSILTNFAEFSVYDCRVKPDKKDPASTARVLYVTAEEYESRWDELAGIFSKEAVYKGSFDRYAESTKKKRGTAEVDTAFLKEIEGWRDELARNIALRNPELSQRELNFAVQRTIDRIIFLRICEDRGIEEYGRLLTLLNSQRVYPCLCQLFQRADERYNSGLFHFRPEKGRAEPPDELTLGLTIDDKVLKEIIRGLYYPDSPYEFSVLPADILGQVYEQFLGKVIRLTPGHRAVVEDKPEVRKAGGVYYTPTYIVDYIVKNTVGELLKGKTPQEVGGLTENWRPSKKLHPLRVLDPACGSGSFLLGAYQYLLDWYRDRYVEDGAEKHAKGRNPRLYRVGLPSPAAGRGFPRSPSPSGRGQGEGEWRLTTAERKRILLTHIYGVDIDPQAVEVTKLSLLLKVLEGETQETLDSFYRLFQERALPDLGNNIKCGNSLIGPDFYETAAAAGLDREELLQINPFDWHAEFPDVFPSPLRGRGSSNFPSPLVGEGRGEGALSLSSPSERGQGEGDVSGGFDAIIGNPPWGQKDIDKDKSFSTYLRAHFRSLHGIFDMFRPFVEQGMELVTPHGYFGMVLPDIVLLKDYPHTRRLILEELELTHLGWWGMAFQDAVIDAATVIGRKGRAAEDHEVHVSVRGADREFSHVIPQRQFWKNERYTFNLHLTPRKRDLLERLAVHPRLAEYFDVHEGVHSGNIRSELFVDEHVDDSCHELYFGRDEITPYHLRWNGRYIRLSALPSRRTPTRYANAGRPEWHLRQKVLVRRTGDFVLAAVDEHGRYASNNFFVLFPCQAHAVDLHGLCALLNSTFMTWYFRTIEPREGRVFAELKIKHLRVFPLPDASSNCGACSELNCMGKLRSVLAQQFAAAKTEHERTALQRQIAATDHQIDQLVYDLYGLTADEIKIVEEATTRA
jgi:hypothetical protein